MQADFHNSSERKRQVAQTNRLYGALHLDDVYEMTSYEFTTQLCNNNSTLIMSLRTEAHAESWWRTMSQAKKEEGITWGPHCLGVREKKRKLVMGTEDCVLS